jgi:DNA processing protein
VFAVPGNINSRRSRGCNTLIKEGKAKLVESIDDILVELTSILPESVRKALRREPVAFPALTLFEKAVYDRLSEKPQHIDTVAGELGFATSDVLVNLLSLEIKGVVKQLAGKMFLRR